MDSIYKQLESYLSTIPHGEASFTVKRHRGQTTLIDIHAFESVKYDSNEAAAAQLLQLIKEYSEAKFTGNMTFTIAFREGEINRIIRQGFRRLPVEQK